MNLQHLDHVAITVRDLAASTAWYERVLGLQRRYADEWDVPVILCAPTGCVALFPCDAPEPEPATDAARSIAMRHFAFRLTGADWREAQHELKREGIPFDFEDHGIAHSVYLADPDGHSIELTTYDV